MRQAFHIFRKDVRRLWPHITIVLLLIASFTKLAMRPKSVLPENFGSRSQFEGLLGVLLPAAYAWLVVTLIHQEALPGDRQFWLTRPYSRGSLLAAKAIFIIIFVTFTMAAKDVAIVAASGFPVLPDLPGFLIRLIAWTAWVVLPAWTVGTVTRDLQGVGLAGAALGLLYVLQGALWRKSFWPGIEWLRDYTAMLLLLIFAAAIVIWQYARRRTATARMLAACCALLVIVGLPLVPWSAAFAIQSRLRQSPGPSGIRILPDVPPRSSQSSVPGPEFIPIRLPVQLRGVPPRMTLVVDAARIAIESGNREIWRSGWQQNPTSYEPYPPLIHMPADAYRSMPAQTLTIHASLAMTLLENEPGRHISAHQGVLRIEGSRCESATAAGSQAYSTNLWCQTAIKARPRMLIRLEAPGISEGLTLAGTHSYAPYEALLDQSPLLTDVLAFSRDPESADQLSRTWELPGAELVITPQRPVAHFLREIEYRNARLAQFVVPVPRAELRGYTIR